MDQLYNQLAPYYDLLHAELVDDIPFLLQLAGASGGKVLELGTGTGRLMIPLLEAGCSVVGVDNNEPMLQRAKERLRPFAGWRLILGDMCTVEIPVEILGKFNLIIIPYNTLMHLDERQVKAVLRRAKEWLEEDGRLIIDLSNPFWLAEIEDDEEPYLDRAFALDDGRSFSQWAMNQIDQEKQEVRIDWRYELRSSSKKEEPIQLSVIYHYYFPHQLALWLKEVGLHLFDLWGGYKGELFDEEAERMVLSIGKQ